MKITKLIKLGVQAGIVWSIAKDTSDFINTFTAAPLGKLCVKLQKVDLKYLAKEIEKNNAKIKNMQEVLNARKKEESAEGVSEDFLQ